MARKGENIYQRKDGRWEARFIVGRREDGKAIYKAVYAKTYSEVKEKRRLALSGADEKDEAGLQLPRAGTVAAVAEAWITESSHKWKASTLSRYQDRLRLYILPEFGGRELSDISTYEVEQYIRRLQETGRDGDNPIKSNTAASVLAVLKQLRKHALKKDCG